MSTTSKRPNAAAARLPDATHVGAAKLQVASLDRSLRYYRDFLGFAQIEQSAGFASLGAHDGERVLLELHEKPGAAPVPRRGRLGLFHFAILLPDRPALGRFAGHLARMGAPAGSSDHLVSEAIYLQDPDGLGIEVYADRPRSAWQRLPGGEVAMATEPLDVASLLRAAGDAPWTGMPQGTVIGHLHLHVGDLGEAERFYHETLGLEVMVRGYPGALFLAAGGYHHHLGVNTWAAQAQPAGPDDARLLEWELVLPGRADVEAALGRFRDAGVAVADDGVVRDPWGTALRLRAER
jgi:catechol 2,3-dioxygenase